MKRSRRYLALPIGLSLILAMVIGFASCVSTTATSGKPAISSITASLQITASAPPSAPTSPVSPTISANLTAPPTSTLLPTSLPTSPPVTSPTSPASPTASPPLIPTSTPSQENNVMISIQLSNFDVVSATGNMTGDGYLIYYMIQLPTLGQFPFPPTTIPATPSPTGTSTLTPLPTTTPSPTLTTPTPSATPLIPGVQQTPSTKLSQVWNNLSSGTYIFSVQLVDTSGMPLSPPVVSAVVFMVP